MTEKAMNCSNLLHMIQMMRNCTGGSVCFMRAFVAPLSWDTLVMNVTDLAPEDFTLLLWGAEPYLQNIPSPLLTLPQQLLPAQLTEIMKLFNELFTSLSLGHRVHISHWAKQQVAQNYFNCTLDPLLGSKPKSQSEHCPATMEWLRADVMEVMGRFLTLLPSSEFEAVPKEELCPFFLSPSFPNAFSGVGPLTPSLARTVLRRVMEECVHDNQQLLQHLGRLGSLACFYGDVSSLNAFSSKALLSKLSECGNTESSKLKKELVMRVVSEEGHSVATLLQLAASATSTLSLPQLALLPVSELRASLSSLGRARWHPAQARMLANTLLQGMQSVPGQDLLSLGSVVRGVGSAVLRRVGPQGLLGTDGLNTLSQELSELQRTALLEGLHSNTSVSEVVRCVSGPLLSSLSLSALSQAHLQTVDQLEGRNWTRAQSAFLVKKILGKTLRPEDIGRLGSAVQGVTCEMIDSLNETEVLAVVQTLTQSAAWLSKTQVRCAAKKLFQSLESKRENYFSNITDPELSAIPALLLLQLAPEKIAGLPDAVCPCFLEKLSQTDLSSLPHSSISRLRLTDRALSCLGKNLSAVTPADITSLGPLVCELEAWRLSGLAPNALNASLLSLTKCPRIHPIFSGAIFELVRATYGDPSDWSLGTMTSLGPLLLLNDSALMSLPYKPWLKTALSDLLDSLPPTPSPRPPEEFITQPDLSALHQKLFSLSTTTAPPSTRVQQWMEDPSLKEPMLLAIEELGERNMHWTPDQLLSMCTKTFVEGVSKLGQVCHYSPQQLQALRSKTIQVWGPLNSLTELQVLQLGCVSQGFSPTELQELNITSLDTLELLSPCSWAQAQREAVLRGFMRRTGLTAGALGTVEMVGLGQFICGLSPQEAEQLNTDPFREALAAVGRVQCTQDMADRLKEKVLVLFGEVGNWTEAQVNTMGNIIAGLNASELQRLKPAVLPFIAQTAIPLIPPERLAAFSPSQLQALGPDNAAMVTDAQHKALAMEQYVALGKALGVTYVRVEVATTVKQPMPVAAKAGE
ncbi:otoancorin-like [Megalops cyprinoides]|uniref:otoancorin-like n=1 Tax=Megalops cyprinoides TaxID=118141 RepID=UPI00186565A9|nr:otoancorin-like [Megalops cyprinoides]